MVRNASAAFATSASKDETLEPVETPDIKVPGRTSTEEDTKVNSRPILPATAATTQHTLAQTCAILATTIHSWENQTT